MISQYLIHHVYPDSKISSPIRFIRAIAARLILIHFIRTRGQSIPYLFSNTSNSLDSQGGKGLPSGKELEFGLKSLSRAGRAILLYIDTSSSFNLYEYSNAAFVNLKLAVNCYIEIQNRANLMTDEINDFVELAQKNVEDGFDAMTLLPDACSFFKRRTDPDKENDVVKHLMNIESFISKLDEVDGDNNVKKMNSNNAFVRFFPCLARVSYKVSLEINSFQKGIYVIHLL